MFIKLESDEADPLRILAGAGDADDLDVTTIFSSNYPPLQVERYAIAYSAAGGTGTITTPTRSVPPLTWALAIADNGSPVFPYYYQYGEYFPTLGITIYQRNHIMWQVYNNRIRYWVLNQPIGGTLYIWNFVS